MNTKKVIIELLLFIVTIICFCYLLFALSMNSDYSVPIAKLTDSESYLTHLDGPNWIIPLIEKVQTRDNSTILLLGDSVARQLFMELSDINEEVCIAPAVSPFTLAGQYVLCNQYLQNHPDATDVYLLIHPDGIYSDITPEYGYQYVVMPLVETDLFTSLDSDTIDNCSSIFGEFFLKPNVVRAIDSSGLNRKLYLNSIAKKQTDDEKKISDTYIHYINKIKACCDSNNVTFHLLSVPISENYYNCYFDKAKEDYFTLEISNNYPNYLDDIQIYQDEILSDGVHFSYPYNTQTYFNQVITKSYEDTYFYTKLIM